MLLLIILRDGLHINFIFQSTHLQVNSNFHLKKILNKFIIFNSAKKIYIMWPKYSSEEINAVVNVLTNGRGNYWSGNEGKLFEKEFSQWSGAKYSISVSNGTIALEAALKSLDIGLKDEVIVTSRTYVASASAISLIGATPVFVDVDLDSQNIDIESIKAAITKRTKAIICVHLAGWPCDMNALMEISEAHNIFVIEDCSQAHGAKYNNKSVGTFGHVGTWSFCHDKIMSTGGEGGMITTSSKNILKKILSYRDHGRDFDIKLNNNNKFQWIRGSIGTNARLTEMQSAIGRIQLQSVDSWVETRRKNLDKIWNAVRNIKGFRVPVVPINVYHAAYKCYVFVQPKLLKPECDRDWIVEELNKRNVESFTGSCPEVYLEKAFPPTTARMKNSKELGDTSIMFKVDQTVDDRDFDKIIETLHEVMKNSRL